jgi:hypothetical protein
MINTKYIYLFTFVLFKFNIHKVIKFINYWVGRLPLSLTESLLSVDSFYFCATLTKNLSNDTCFCLMEMWQCIVVEQIHHSHCHSLTWVVLFYKFLHCFPHFTHLSNLIWREGCLSFSPPSQSRSPRHLAVARYADPFLTNTVIISFFLLPSFSTLFFIGAIVVVQLIKNSHYIWTQNKKILYTHTHTHAW